MKDFLYSFVVIMGWVIVSLISLFLTKLRLPFKIFQRTDAPLLALIISTFIYCVVVLLLEMIKR